MAQNDPGKIVGGTAAGCGTGCLINIVFGMVIMFAALGGMTGEGSEAMMPSWTIAASLILSIVVGTSAGYVCRLIAKSQTGTHVMAGIYGLYSVYGIIKLAGSEGPPELTAEQQKGLDEGPEILRLMAEAGAAAQNGPLWPAIAGAVVVLGTLYFGASLAAKKQDSTLQNDE
jgi:hypothetical protein